MGSNNYIKLDRDVIHWDHYKNSATSRVFFHLLLIANYTDKGRVKRGQVNTTIKDLAFALEISAKEVNYALRKLRETKEITSVRHDKGTLITINNYEKYQGEVTKTEKPQKKTNSKQKLPPGISESDREEWLAAKNQ